MFAASISIFSARLMLCVKERYTVPKQTRNSSGDEIANVNFLYDTVHALKI